jgi:uncharacterized membrane protein
MFLLWIAIIVLFIITLRNSGRISTLENKVTGKVEATAKAVVPGVSNTNTEPAREGVAPSSAPVANLTNSSPDQKPLSYSKHDEESSGKILGRIGVAAVLIGVAFFLKYAFENNWVGPTGRVMIGVMIGVAFLVVGQVLRKKYLKYSDLLMGGGSGILYLAFFSAYSFYHLITAPVAGLLMIGVTALTFAISIVNATITLSFVGIVGAFVTPFLVGYVGNNMLSLFTYLSIINAGVLGISFFKKWPKLNILSFAGTAINFMVWFGVYYSSNVLGPTLTFCFVTFVIFLLANIMRSVVAGTKSDNADFFLIGANAFALAILGYIILNPNHHSILGFASVFVAIVYMIFAFMVNKTNPGDKTLNIFLPGLAVTFLSLAVPLQFDGPWIAVAWLIESVALYFIASIISNRGFQVMGVVVYSIGLLDLLVWIGDNFDRSSFVPIFNTAFVVTVLAIMVAYVIAFFYKKYGSTTVEIQKRGIMVFVIIANILSVYALTSEVTKYYNNQIRIASENYQIQNRQNQIFDNTYDSNLGSYSTYNSVSQSLRNRSNTWVSILWTLYAAILTAIGFAKRISSVRRLGLALFLITAIKVLFDVWSLGQLYRIISFVVFGIIALVASFAYAKYKDRL